MDTTPTVTTTERGLLMLMLMPRLFTDTMDILTVLVTTLATLDTDTLATPTPTVQAIRTLNFMSELWQLTFFDLCRGKD